MTGTTRAQAIVVGGGIIGLSTAYHLARSSGISVALLEKSEIGAGASGQSNACIRSNYTHRDLAHMAVKSLHRMRGFADEFGADPGFTETGYLMAVDHPNEATARHSVAIQREAGAQTAFVSPEEAQRLAPGMRADDLAGAIYEPQAGTLEPSFVLDAVARASRRLGVDIRRGVPVQRIDAAPGRRPAVVIDGQRMEADLVLNAAGAWAPALQPRGAAPLPVTTFRHQIGLLELPRSATGLGMVLVDMVEELSYRPDTGRIVRVGAASREGADNVVHDPDRLRRGADPQRLDEYATKVIRRFPDLAESGFRGGYSAFIDLSPDSQFILGSVAGCDGYFVAAGMSGHAFKHGLLIGQGLADTMLTGHTDAFPIAMFGVDRFERGALIRPELPYTRGKGHLGGPSSGNDPLD